MNILLTGGTGYIGSHTAVALLERGHNVSIVDNLSNSLPEVLDKITEITGRCCRFFEADIRNRSAMDAVFSEGAYDAVVHMAGLKAMGESLRMPMAYYSNNVVGTVSLCEAMEHHGVRNMVFSSSAAVYGNPSMVPIRENAPLSPANPYGRSKRMIEEILNDFFVADPRWNISILRYFNPMGAHRSGSIGELQKGEPINLMPYITQAAAGKRDKLHIYGGDYPTADGTGIRDYIHVMDLAEGHVKALEKSVDSSGYSVYNLGTGCGYSVLEVIKSFEAATGLNVPYEVAPRRAGDVAVCYADVSKAERELGWRAKYTLADMCRDAWSWQKNSLR